MEQARERHEHVDAGPPLRVSVPELDALTLWVSERHGDPAKRRECSRQINVPSAPTKTTIPCVCCSEGTHDITVELIDALRRHATHSTGDALCSRCGCVMRYTTTAMYAQT